MTHLTLTGCDRPQLTFSPNNFYEREAKVETEAQTHPVLSDPLVFSSVYVADAGWIE